MKSFFSGFLIASLLGIGFTVFGWNFTKAAQPSGSVLSQSVQVEYWMLLHRKSNKEYLYKGIPGNVSESTLLKEFIVKVGIPNERPTPLPKLLGREYWLLIEKHPELDSPETAPYFITLDIPSPSVSPFGPQPYLECGGEQCNWNLPGSFGLHGVNGDMSRLSIDDPGSSGCIRHQDTDITYIYNLLDFSKGGVRYYIEDI